MIQTILLIGLIVLALAGLNVRQKQIRRQHLYARFQEIGFRNARPIAQVQVIQ